MARSLLEGTNRTALQSEGGDGGHKKDKGPQARARATFPGGQSHAVQPLMKGMITIPFSREKGNRWSWSSRTNIGRGEGGKECAYCTLSVLHENPVETTSGCVRTAYRVLKRSNREPGQESFEGTVGGGYKTKPVKTAMT